MNETYHSSSHDGGDDFSYLARLAKEGETKRDREEAFAQLTKLIKAIAVFVVNKKKDVSPKSTLRDDFIENAPSLIWERFGSYDPMRPFKPWCAVVLENALTDELRKQGRHHARFKSESDLFASSVEEGTRGCRDCLENIKPARQVSDLRKEDCFEALSDRDITLLETELTAKARVTVLVVAGLWVRVPSHIWEKWLDEGGYPRGFPPDEVLDLEDVGERVKAVAEELGEARPCITMRWRRSLPVLRQLSIFHR